MIAIVSCFRWQTVHQVRLRSGTGLGRWPWFPHGGIGITPFASPWQVSGLASAGTKVRPTSFPSRRNTSQVVVFALRVPGPRSAAPFRSPGSSLALRIRPLVRGRSFSAAKTSTSAGAANDAPPYIGIKNRRNPGLLPATPSQPFASSAWSWTAPFPWRSGVRSSSSHRRSNPTGRHQAGRARSVGTAGTANRRRSQTAAICWFSSRAGSGRCAPPRSRSPGLSRCSSRVVHCAVDRDRDAPSPQSPTRRDRTAWRWSPRP